MLTNHVYNIQLKSYNISPLSNGKIGKKDVINNAFRNHYLSHRSYRKKEMKKKRKKYSKRGGISEIY
ncbi:hypothetical protein Bmyc01_60870 [Bacillus mycoides]|nr:hypothetical protein Bmyc01_60870 [Bacillus mycoides]